MRERRAHKISPKAVRQCYALHGLYSATEVEVEVGYVRADQHEVAIRLLAGDMLAYMADARYCFHIYQFNLGVVVPEKVIFEPWGKTAGKTGSGLGLKQLPLIIFTMSFSH